MRPQERWLIILAAIFAFCTWRIRAVDAAGGTQEAPDLEIALSTPQSTVSEGDVVWWQVSLLNTSANALTQVKLEPTDQSWLWPEGTKVIGTLAEQDGIVVDIPAVPLEAGDVWPTLRVRYTIGDAHRSILVSGIRPVKIIPIRTLVAAEAVPKQTTARVGQPLPVEVFITNRSPFTFTSITLQGIGADMEWGEAVDVRDLPPRMTTVVPLTPTIRAENPVAILSFAYHWTDRTGRESSETLVLRGKPVRVEIPWWSQISPSMLTALITGLLGLGSWGLKSLIERRQRERLTRERVKGMLEIIRFQAEYGAQECGQVPIDLLQQLLSEEGLYAALSQLNKESQGLVECVQELWWDVHRHNVGITDRGGGTRTTDLRAKVERLGAHLRDLSLKTKD